MTLTDRDLISSPDVVSDRLKYRDAVERVLISSHWGVDTLPLLSQMISVN